MKTIHWMGAALVCLPLAVRAQLTATEAEARRIRAGDYVITERGPHHRV